ncbi:MAG: hypothetical protein HZA53_10385 [Planctomycetes bacterium]|nr:hypothetical protein [Planctomycetota bacterium]
MARLHLLLGLPFAAIVAGCGTTRAGWGKGSFRELHESGELQIRRAYVRVDERTGELLLPWIGARIPVGVEGEVARCELVIYRDDDRDHQLDPDEAVSMRSNAQAGVKVLFEDVRVSPPATGVELVARIEVVASSGARVIQFLFRDEAELSRR